jgi:hypothetical protein
VQHGALVEERKPGGGGGVQYRRAEVAPDAFVAAGGEALVDTDDEDAVPAAAQRAAKEHPCAQFLPVRPALAMCFQLWRFT